MTALTYDSRSQLRGVIAAGVSATSFGVSITFATVAYAGGSDPLTVVAFRTVAGLLISLAIVSFVRRPLLPERNAMTPLMLMVAGLLFVNYGYNWSVHYIPISLAVLVFYTFPLIVLAVEALGNWRLPAVASLFAFVLAFIGLGLALGPSFAELNWRGLLCAGLASVGGVLMFVFGARAARTTGLMTMTVFTHIIAGPLTIMAVFAFGGPALPTTGLGWLGLNVAAAAYVNGLLFQFIAMRLVAPALAAMVFNMEPLAVIVLATLYLGERLEMVQYAGGVCVLAAILIASRQRIQPIP